MIIRHSIVIFGIASNGYLREYILFFSDGYGQNIRDKPTKKLVDNINSRLKLSDESIEQITAFT